ncbi:hypothetical protein IPC1152_33765 [Pseudomonas aeruginosa]|nr:hypothetical protein IPC1152_33765 [Pseudomonas aeruginosa]
MLGHFQALKNGAQAKGEGVMFILQRKDELVMARTKAPGVAFLLRNVRARLVAHRFPLASTCRHP